MEPKFRMWSYKITNGAQKRNLVPKSKYRAVFQNSFFIFSFENNCLSYTVGENKSFIETKKFGS